MDLQQLRYFQAVVEQGSISKAAELLHIAQPSLSISIAKLENELGVKLFDRMNHRIQLNHIGERFYARTQRIFVDVKEALTEISDIAGSHTKEVKIASTASNICTELLSFFMAEHPDYHITQFIHGQPHVQELLETGSIDFAITTGPFESGIIEWTPLIQEQLVILMSKKHTLATAKELSIPQVRNERFVLLRSAFHPEGEFADSFKAAGFQPSPAFITNEYEVMAAMVEQNVGIAVASELTVRKLLKNYGHWLIGIPLDCTTGRTIGLAHLRGHYFTKAVEIFYHYAVDFFSGLNNSKESEAQLCEH